MRGTYNLVLCPHCCALIHFKTERGLCYFCEGAQGWLDWEALLIFCAHHCWPPWHHLALPKWQQELPTLLLSQVSSHHSYLDLDRNFLPSYIHHVSLNSSRMLCGCVCIKTQARCCLGAVGRADSWD